MYVNYSNKGYSRQMVMNPSRPHSCKSSHKCDELSCQQTFLRTKKYRFCYSASMHLYITFYRVQISQLVFILESVEVDQTFTKSLVSVQQNTFCPTGCERVNRGIRVMF